MNYQKVILVGNVTDNAQKKTSKQGAVTYTIFDLAVGDAKDKSTFFPVVVFGENAEAVAKYVTKGRLVLVEGRIEVNDNKRFNVVADNVRFGPEPTTKKRSQ